jgi:hypothetical protein
MDLDSIGSRVQCQVRVNMIVYLQVPLKMGSFLNNYVITEVRNAIISMQKYVADHQKERVW